MRTWLSGVLILSCSGCSGAALEGGAVGAPSEPELPSAPSEPAPTGSRWSGVVVEGECGRKTVEYRLVDEVCGETSNPAYLDAFRTPMFRDGARVGDTLFTVDGTHLWALDVNTPESAKRVSISSGYGSPLGAAVHGASLVLASGGEGLVLVDAAVAVRPVRTGGVALEGPALAVHVEGDSAFVAAGAAGVAIVDLSGPAPVLERTLDIGGFAASVTKMGDVAVVAACSEVVFVDLTTDDVLARVSLAASADDEAEAPAKGVAVVGQVAFVAAGRWGAIALDVTDPGAPERLGNCTVDDPLFYASGVRASGDRLFVAGGEWGVLSVDVTEPATACAALSTPSPILPEAPSGDPCTSEPPWEVVDWQDRWAPPPPPPPVLPPAPPRGRDPVQVLPDGEVLYAFGDARRIGVRALDVRTADHALVRLGRYEEPGLVQAIAARDGRVLVAGPAGGLFHRDDAALLVRDEGVVEGVEQAVAAGIFEDGRWILGFGDGRVQVEGHPQPGIVAERLWPGTLTTRGTELLTASGAGVRVMDVDSLEVSFLPFTRPAELPPSVALDGDRIVAAAPEWTSARVMDATGDVELEAHGAFTEDEISDPARWHAGLPRRLLAQTEAGTVEVASLAKRTALVVHGAFRRSVSLPPADYVAMAGEAERVHMVSADRDEYRSQLVTVDLSVEGPSVTRVRSFTGMATGIAVDGDRVYVADADRGVRVYDEPGAREEPLGVVELEGAR